MSKPRVMIASPTPGMVKTVNMKSIIATMNDLANRGIYCAYETVDAADLAHQRNILASRFLRSDCTHLFFDDSDMMHDADLCFAMLNHSKPIVGIIAAAKRFYLDRMKDAVARGCSFEEAFLFAHDWFAFLPPGRDQIVVENGLLEVKEIGFGVTLIHRSALELMISNGAAKGKSYPNHQPVDVYNFFGARAETALNGEHVAEDMAFSQRWLRDCGGQIWAHVDATIYHVGDFAYGGNYFKLLQAKKRFQETASPSS